MKHKIYILCFLICCAFSGYGQDNFVLTGSKKSHSLSFKLINNLVVLPIEVNGEMLNFILDTGVDKSLLFNLKEEDSLRLKNIKRIKIRGLGEGERLSGIESKENQFRIGKIVNLHHKIYAITGDDFDLSGRMEIDINGIIGSELFNDFIVEINYTSKRITFHRPDTYVYKDCESCETLDIEFYQNKPYVNAKILDVAGREADVKLLIDSGGGDALWLFDQSHENIVVPSININDFLGRGLSGNIYGKRGRIQEFSLGKFKFSRPLVAYPDSTSVGTVYNHESRNGTMGAEILKRFKPIIDYHNKKITLKKNARYFNNPFDYNMSGVELIYTEPLLFSERRSETSMKVADRTNLGRVANGTNLGTTLQFSYVFDFKKSFQIAYLREDSPAHKAGLQEGDIIVTINGRAAKELKLGEIMHILSTKSGKKINLLIQRQDEELTYSFRLEELIGKG